MEQPTRIYTRSGDSGKTSLGDGTQVPKYAIRVSAYGTVDEINAILGIARLHVAGEVIPTASGEEPAEAALERIQNDLFDLGTDLARADGDAPARVDGDAPARVDGDAPARVDGDAPARVEAVHITQAQVTRLESEIDTLSALLPPLANFVLPGGRPAAAHLHHARTVARRAERLIAELNPDGSDQATSEADTLGLRYVNRLSDYLLVLARFVNDRGVADVLWLRPGARPRA
ncbi:cob(I)yrinic acid a,c-diamide adenosyltransferase [Rhodospirillum rubrum]|uniref:Corrinoid adenosyltransferase n=1 Tax=Rhodospirillum rubrum (strain ATCC 11170 / ATH 1.1.1 / DSM 467 / LMG 4362 / NCIMB 8255 / S1) TaxID=269796 RepID=Q2RPS4_RHORT|nr:cob(I)yrinic acid a,c-diamide adenosyltransferase [Rhodospirillum rubrum]ABC23871.1 ATP:cob(I)alamin adenosyltransferase [Rhodospirillum rubrum ATCC 11170]AEO49614.1 ATP:cob(I)alamin adenosyltransferase [Rhodospirillum rubrum F11]MBK5955547.1 ATP--cob(I)alamin adenosyltransferase [Rhodospirillum rubrum]QXG79817.1 cob(I)yrinic acid a,c-diamide adenosyltransferase [Rhodospirillum rubrum]HAQ00824.1 cob(I)yrinic acid a,c-diamide adenosyltransferase [Rhodospirillum rubrum]